MAEATVSKQMLAISPHESNDFLLPRHLSSLETKQESADHQSISLKPQRVNDWEKTWGCHWCKPFFVKRFLNIYFPIKEKKIIDSNPFWSTACVVDELFCTVLLINKIEFVRKITEN